MFQRTLESNPLTNSKPWSHWLCKAICFCFDFYASIQLHFTKTFTFTRFCRGRSINASTRLSQNHLTQPPRLLPRAPARAPWPLLVPSSRREPNKPQKRPQTTGPDTPSRALLVGSMFFWLSDLPFCKLNKSGFVCDEFFQGKGKTPVDCKSHDSLHNDRIVSEGEADCMTD